MIILTGRIWGRGPVSRLQYNQKDPKASLNPKAGTGEKPLESRDIFKGYYEDDIIEVAIQRVLQSKDTITEITRECQILRILENHKNFIRYYCYERDRDFV